MLGRLHPLPNLSFTLLNKTTRALAAAKAFTPRADTQSLSYTHPQYWQCHKLMG